MRLAAAALCALLVLPRIVAAQGLEPEDPTTFASAQQAPGNRGIVVRQRVMLDGVPRPGNQWRRVKCVAWAVAYAAGSYYHRARLTGANAELSPAFAYALGNGDARCLASSRISKMLDVLRDVGGIPLSDYAYDPGWCGRVPTEAERRRAAAFRIPGWAVVPGLDPTAAKAQLVAGRVVIFSMGVGPAFSDHRGKKVFDVLETGSTCMATRWWPLVSTTRFKPSASRTPLARAGAMEVRPGCHTGSGGSAPSPPTSSRMHRVRRLWP